MKTSLAGGSQSPLWIYFSLLICAPLSHGSDVLQRRRGCNTNSSAVSAFDEWGVNGEDFLTFDPQTLKWTALSDRAIALAAEWNKLDIRNHVFRNFGQNVCPETYHTLRISKAAWVNNTGQTDMELHVFVKPVPENAFSCIRCHVTGSDLSGVRIQLTKDGVPLDSGVKLIGPRPNGDGTNQMRVWVELRLKDTERYECQVQRGTEDKHVQLEGYTLEFQHTVYWGPDGTLHFHQTTVFEGKPIFYCNSTTLTDQPRQHWIREAFGPDELNSRHEYCKKQYSAHKQWFQDIDQTIGGTAKILQRRGGCSVGVSGAIVFDAWGLNGGDFLAFEHEGLTWTPVSELASSVALKWNKEHSCSSNAVREDDYYTHFSQQVCEKFGHEIQSWYKETDQTGVRIQLTKNGIPLHSGVKLIGPRPKGDGTNQMRVQAQMSLSDTKGYRCNIHRRSFDFSVLWDGLAGDASGLMRALLYCFAVLVAVLLYMAVMQTVWQSD
ncbi:hypothetical protein ACEWY4_022702 [Coilia grayii]|uniref:Uncharacterized protein n=1 Tax=Coilia grayii TaxID=363190 RepID=A0ABD1J102_9TELE